jgi:hypothetical protein
MDKNQVMQELIKQASISNTAKEKSEGGEKRYHQGQYDAYLKVFDLVKSIK